MHMYYINQMKKTRKKIEKTWLKISKNELFHLFKVPIFTKRTEIAEKVDEKVLTSLYGSGKMSNVIMGVSTIMRSSVGTLSADGSSLHTLIKMWAKAHEKKEKAV